jgi:hypothetical protein
MAAVLWLLLTCDDVSVVCFSLGAVTTTVWPPESVETEAALESVLEAADSLVPLPLEVDADTEETELSRPVV